jgi:phage/plasmid-associated DNA primase
MFDGYVCGRLDAKSLARSSDTFATEQLSTNPLILIQHDGDLSRIEDNTKLNSIVSHEEIKINAKFKNEWSLKPQSFLFMGTNKPVQITDAKSGLLRRLIDVHPTGNLIETNRYYDLMEAVKFEYGAIAYKCLQKYQEMGKSYYNTYDM